MSDRSPQSGARLAIVWIGLAGAGCGTSAGEDTANAQDAGDAGADAASGVLPALEFALPAPIDFGYNPYLGIDRSRRHLYIGLSDTATAADLERALEAGGAALGGTIPGAAVAQLVLVH